LFGLVSLSGIVTIVDSWDFITIGWLAIATIVMGGIITMTVVGLLLG
jgi:hypothetical protein